MKIGPIYINLERPQDTEYDSGKNEGFLSHASCNINTLHKLNFKKKFMWAPNVKTNTKFEYRFESDIYLVHIFFFCVILQIKNL